MLLTNNLSFQEILKMVWSSPGFSFNFAYEFSANKRHWIIRLRE